jgi:hypothetical protein
MDYAIEAIIFVIMVFIVIGRPEGLMTIGNTLIGRALMIALIVCLALKSTVGGLLGALLLVVVSESLIEGMETEKNGKGKEEEGKGKGAKGKDGKGKDGKGKGAKGKDEDEDEDDEEDEGAKDAKGKDAKGKDAKGKTKDVKGKDELATHKEELSKLMGGTDLVGLTEKFSKLRSLADAINRSQ